MNLKTVRILRMLYRSMICTVGIFTASLCLCIKMSEVLTEKNMAEMLYSVTVFCSDGILKEYGEAEYVPYTMLPSESDGMPIYSIDESEFGPEDPIPLGYKKIISADLSSKDIKAIKNETSYDISFDTSPYEAEQGDSPCVLIIHTHATECYMDEDEEYYGDGIPTRSQNCDENMLSVGQAVCEYLNRHGIKAIQCREMFDKDDYNASYSYSLEGIKEYLKKYPDIEYVFDIHRDAIVRSDGSAVKPVITNGKKSFAQVMLLCGTDEKGGYFPTWRENFAFACAIQKEMNGICNNIMRPILVRGATYHQQYAKHFLLLEIGSFANTTEEALNSAEVFAEALSGIILSQ